MGRCAFGFSRFFTIATAWFLPDRGGPAPEHGRPRIHRFPHVHVSSRGRAHFAGLRVCARREDDLGTSQVALRRIIERRAIVGLESPASLGEANIQELMPGGASPSVLFFSWRSRSGFCSLHSHFAARLAVHDEDKRTLFVTRVVSQWRPCRPRSHAHSVIRVRNHK